MKRWTTATGGHFKDGKLPNNLLFLNSFQPLSASACCLKWESYLSMLEAWLTFISGFQETHLKQSINSVPNRVAISVERSKIQCSSSAEREQHQQFVCLENCSCHILSQ